jgi:uncharacterized protein YkwD
MKWLLLILLISCTKEQLPSGNPIEQSFVGFDLEVFNEINDIRESRNLPLLKGEKGLNEGCFQHVNYMIAVDSLNHNYFLSRYINSGAVHFGEVVAYGYYSPFAFVSAYSGSESHLNQLLGNYDYIGIATIGQYQCIDLAKYRK